LAKDVKDYQGAEILCLNGGNFKNRSRGTKAATTSEGVATSKVTTAELDKRRKLFMILLKEYLRLPEDDGGMSLTLRLLNSQSSYLDISEVSLVLPLVQLFNCSLLSLAVSTRVTNECTSLTQLYLGGPVSTRVLVSGSSSGIPTEILTEELSRI
jgi:hypothetical protein